MKTPICEVCALTTSLCASCRKKLEEGTISEKDVEVSRLLYKKKSDFSLDSVELVKTIDLEKFLVLLTKTDVGYLIGKNGRVASSLAKDLGKRIKVIKLGSELRSVVEELAFPAKPSTISTVFKKTGTERVVKIPRREVQKLPISLKELNSVLKEIFGPGVSASIE